MDQKAAAAAADRNCFMSRVGAAAFQSRFLCAQNMKKRFCFPLQARCDLLILLRHEKVNFLISS